jgi:hypothetical protein
MSKSMRKTQEPKFAAHAHYFSGLMGEAIYAIVQAHRLQEEAIKLQGEGDDSSTPPELLAQAGMSARYAFLSACNALENAAYSILVNSERLSSSLVEELNHLNTLNKFEVFGLMHGKTIDRGNDCYARVKQVVKCRNAFVHPKGISVPFCSETMTAEPRLISGREYPQAFDFLEVKQAAAMIGDILRFVAWVVFDICGLSAEAGTELINGGSLSWTGDCDLAHEIWHYDVRSFGRFKDPERSGVLTWPRPKKRKRGDRKKKSGSILGPRKSK